MTPAEYGVKLAHRVVADLARREKTADAVDLDDVRKALGHNALRYGLPGAAVGALVGGGHELWKQRGLEQKDRKRVLRKALLGGAVGGTAGMLLPAGHDLWKVHGADIDYRPRTHSQALDNRSTDTHTIDGSRLESSAERQDNVGWRAENVGVVSKHRSVPWAHGRLETADTEPYGSFDSGVPRYLRPRYVVEALPEQKDVAGRPAWGEVFGYVPKAQDPQKVDAFVDRWLAEERQAPGGSRTYEAETSEALRTYLKNLKR